MITGYFLWNARTAFPYIYSDRTTTKKGKTAHAQRTTQATPAMSNRHAMSAYVKKKFFLSPARSSVKKIFSPARPLQEKNLRAGKTPIPQISKEGSPRHLHSVLHTRLAKFKSGGGGYIFWGDKSGLIPPRQPPGKGTQK